MFNELYQVKPNVIMGLDDSFKARIRFLFIPPPVSLSVSKVHELLLGLFFLPVHPVYLIMTFSLYCAVLPQTVNGFMTAFRPVGSFVHEFVTLTHQVNFYSYKGV